MSLEEDSKTTMDAEFHDDDMTLKEESLIDEKSQENYRVWKKNTPFLYDYLSTNSLLWPSLTVQFFPDLETSLASSDNSGTFDNRNDQEVHIQRILHGSFTLGQSVDSISIAQIPYYSNLNQSLNINKLNYNYDKQEFEMNTVTKKKLNVLQRINHFGDVNRARYMPQNPDIIASCNNMGDLVIYDRTKHSNFKNAVTGDDVNISKPQLRLVNENNSTFSDTFAIDWNKQKESVIISADMEGSISIFDIKNKLNSGNDHTLNQSSSYENSGVGVNDIEWIVQHDSLFTMVDEAGFMKIHDTRKSNSVVTEKKHTNGVDSVSVNPGNVYCIATGDASGAINVWDIRNSETSTAAYTIQKHDNSITQLKWHPKHHSVLGSSSSDKLVKFFDLSDFDNNNGLFFVHGGHMLGVNDFDWSSHDTWMTASVADDNSLHIWKPTNDIVKGYSVK